MYLKLKAALEVVFKRYSDWQEWRLRLIKILENHVNSGIAYLLLRELLKDEMIVLQNISEITLRKAMYLWLFLQLIYKYDEKLHKSVSNNIYIFILAERSGKLIRFSKAFVYRVYKEWRDRQEAKEIQRQEKNDSNIDDSEWFKRHKKRIYEYKFIMDKEDLKVKFKRWMQKNLQKMSVNMA